MVYQVDCTWELWMYRNKGQDHSGNWGGSHSQYIKGGTLSFTHVHVHKHTHTNTRKQSLSHPVAFFSSKKAERKHFWKPFMLFALSYQPTETREREKVRCELHSATCQGHVNSTANCFPKSAFFHKRCFFYWFYLCFIENCHRTFMCVRECDCLLFKATSFVAAVWPEKTWQSHGF